MNEKYQAGRSVAARLFPAENTIDDALLAAASLEIELVGARRVMQAPCGTNQGMLSDLAAAKAALVEARGNMVRLHAKIVKARNEFGMEELSFGCMHPCLGDETPPIEARLKIAS